MAANSECMEDLLSEEVTETDRNRRRGKGVGDAGALPPRGNRATQLTRLPYRKGTPGARSAAAGSVVLGSVCPKMILHLKQKASQEVTAKFQT